MLEKPDLQDAMLVEWLLDHHGLQVVELHFLPTNYQNTAAYHVLATDAHPFFLKLRLGPFEEASVALPVFLREQGMQAIIAPLADRAGGYWDYLDDYNVILYPFIDGSNAFKAPLTESQWFQLGSSLQRIHSTELPPGLKSRIKPETYAGTWREQVKELLERVQHERFDEPAAAEFATFLKAKSDEILYLVRKAEQLAATLQTQHPEPVLCHSDLHAGNILCSTDGGLYIVDWDNPILAPRERDLMFIGAGVGGIWNTPEEEALFYRGYGPTEINPAALAYYRFERILEDIAPNVEKLFMKDVINIDRSKIRQGLADFFKPNGVVDMAYQAEKLLPITLQ
jgi:spectinomycin phosphotransferase